MKKILIVVFIGAAGLNACKNNNPSGTPARNDTTFINRHADSASGGTAGGSVSPVDTTGQKKDSAK